MIEIRYTIFEMRFYCAITTVKQFLKNIFICWLAVLEHIPDNFGDPNKALFNNTYRRLGFSTFLMTAIIKYCKVVNDGPVSLYLQVKTNNQGGLSMYLSNGFILAGTQKSTLHKSLQKNLSKNTWLDQDDLMLLKCKTNYF